MKEKLLYIAIELSGTAICAAFILLVVFAFFTPEGVSFVDYWSAK